MKKQTIPFLSVIIPVFNEEKRIKNINNIITFLKKQQYKWEVIIVNDGSSDKTIAMLKFLKNKLKFKLISLPKNQGKGAAIKMGMLTASGKYRLFLDVDLSTPIEEFNKLKPQLKKFDIVIGSRKMKGSSVIIRQSFIREFLGKLFTFLSQITLQMKISDFTCGFKCFSQKAADQIFPLQTINRWGFDSEILYIGKLKNYSIIEVPVKWRNAPGTKVKFPDAIINSLLELVIIEVNGFRGLYR